MQEKRLFLRYKSSILIQVHAEDQTPQCLQALVNISEGGLAFESEKPWPLESKLRISWPAPLDFSVDFQTLEGYVMWCRPHEKNSDETPHYEVGVQFRKPDLEAVDMTGLIEELYNQLGAAHFELLPEDVIDKKSNQ